MRAGIETEEQAAQLHLLVLEALEVARLDVLCNVLHVVLNRVPARRVL